MRLLTLPHTHTLFLTILWTYLPLVDHSPYTQYTSMLALCLLSAQFLWMYCSWHWKCTRTNIFSLINQQNNTFSKIFWYSKESKTLTKKCTSECFASLQSVIFCKMFILMSSKITLINHGTPNSVPLLFYFTDSTPIKVDFQESKSNWWCWWNMIVLSPLHLAITCVLQNFSMLELVYPWIFTRIHISYRCCWQTQTQESYMADYMWHEILHGGQSRHFQTWDTGQIGCGGEFWQKWVIYVVIKFETSTL